METWPKTPSCSNECGEPEQLLGVGQLVVIVELFRLFCNYVLWGLLLPLCLIAIASIIIIVAVHINMCTAMNLLSSP